MKLQKDTQEMLDSLTAAVAETLEKKRRLGQYAVVWQDNQLVIVENNDAKAGHLQGIRHESTLSSQCRDD